MELFEAIRTRRSIGKVSGEPIAKEMIEQILDAAVWAPNHRMTEPWHFTVMTGEGRDKLGEAYAQIARAQAVDPEGEEAAKAAENARKKAFRALVVIAVAAVPSGRSDLFEIEEICAVSAAAQNMLLAAHALGLGAIWRTGAPCYDPLMNEAFDLRPQDKMLGFIYIGRPDMAPPVPRRIQAAEKTVWVE
ncbi:nitroreductase [Paenibacillus sp. GCM10027626]|uniref:nitroreductase family protein n=1 Tax=Paenibacillus sp. GCM10027626 TaxID=3273411 RepID=UPI003627A49D